MDKIKINTTFEEEMEILAENKWFEDFPSLTGWEIRELSSKLLREELDQGDFLEDLNINFLDFFEQVNRDLISPEQMGSKIYKIVRDKLWEKIDADLDNRIEWIRETNTKVIPFRMRKKQNH